MGTSNVAIHIDGVSKIYRLWDNPKARLAYPFRRAVNALLPKQLQLGPILKNQFREFYALQEISLTIRKGESWGFIGVNGSGKSTLLKIISGNLRPSSGCVEIEGKTAILDYSSGLNGEFTGRANILHKATLLGLTQREVEDRLESIIEFAEIGEFIDQPVKTYSSGMAARLGFAIMAHVDVDIMITDEALAVGDAFFVQKCMRHIHNFLNHGTFLFVSHSINDVLTLCDNVVWLERGYIKQVGSAKVVCHAYMDSLLRRNDDAFYQERQYQNTRDDDEGISSETSLKTDGSSQFLSLSAEQIASLKNHFRPKLTNINYEPSARFQIIESDKSIFGLVEKRTMHGGRIISAEILNDFDSSVTVFYGGESIRVIVRVIAEREVKKALIGFQLFNRLGLAIIGENNNLASGGEILSIEPGEVASVTFKFVMPALAAGEYILRLAFHDGGEVDLPVIDVLEDAFRLQCLTTGERHGLAGIILLGLDVKKESGLKILNQKKIC